MHPACRCSVISLNLESSMERESYESPFHYFSLFSEVGNFKLFSVVSNEMQRTVQAPPPPPPPAVELDDALCIYYFRLISPSDYLISICAPFCFFIPTPPSALLHLSSSSSLQSLVSSSPLEREEATVNTVEQKLQSVGNNCFLLNLSVHKRKLKKKEL